MRDSAKVSLARDPIVMAKKQAKNDVRRLEEAVLQKEQEIALYRQQVEELRHEARAKFIAQLKQEIMDSIFDYHDITSELWRDNRAGINKKRRHGPPKWRMKDSPECTYTQGQLPQCVLSAMRAMGLDPKLPGDREKFFDARMERADDSG